MNALAISNMTAVRMAVIAERTNSVLMAGAKAMMIESLKEKLRNGVAHFVYLKKNGELREAFGTTNPALVAKYTKNGCSPECFSCTAYIDIEHGGEWRSFRWENLVKVF